MKFPKPPSRATEKRARRAAHAAETAVIRAAVILRSRGRCEACGEPASSGEMDHWLGGSGRRREQQSVETCWWLCISCGQERTHNIPSARAWNVLRSAFCALRGYPFTPHLEKMPVQRIP